MEGSCDKKMKKEQEKGQLVSGKKKFPLWAKEETFEAVKSVYRKDNCSSQSEFIEKAIIFYLGYLSVEKMGPYFSNTITSTLKSIVEENTNRQNRMLFKLAVEMALMMNLIASSQDIDKTSLERLRGECVKEVKRTNGSFSFEDAYEWQKG